MSSVTGGNCSAHTFTPKKRYCIWFTGLSGAGKSTLANAVQARLQQLGADTYVLDGDNLRCGLNADLGFDKQSRQENVRRAAHVANLMVEAGILVLATFISPFGEDRARVRSILSEQSLIEVYVECPLDVCIGRDPKGLYAKARGGLIQDFTGIDSPYEPPLNPEITVNTAMMSVSECAERIIQYLTTT